MGRGRIAEPCDLPPFQQVEWFFNRDLRYKHQIERLPIEAFSENWGGFFLKTPRNLSVCLAGPCAYPWTNNEDRGWIGVICLGLRPRALEPGVESSASKTDNGDLR